MKITKRWQKRHIVIQHLTLASAAAMPLFLLQLDLSIWLKGSLALVSCALSILLGVWLTRQWATSVIQVYPFESNVAVGLVQSSLNRGHILFQRMTTADGARFTLRREGVTLVVGAYSLNLPIDDQIEPRVATKIEIVGLMRENREFVDGLCQHIDDVVAKRVG